MSNGVSAAIIGGIAVIVAAFIGWGPSGYLKKPTWRITPTTNPAVILNDPDLKAEICYENGDGATVGVDNNNEIDPAKGNFIPIALGSCATFSISSGPNLGLFLAAGASSASGTYQLVP